MPELDRRAYRIVQGLDSAAALVDSRRVIAAAAEERFTREKGTGEFPAHAIAYCLRAGGIDPASLDCIAHAFDYEPLRSLFCHDAASAEEFETVYSRSAQLEQLDHHFPGVDWQQRFVGVPHHLAHAASTFYVSGFEESLILVADGMGEQHSMTVASGSPRGIEILGQVPELHSLGILYGAFTLYLGFDFNFDEYKVMGLAPYGDRSRYFKQIMDMVKLAPDGSYTVPALCKNLSAIERATYGGTLRYLAEVLGPARAPGEPIEQRHMDIAAAIQSVLETALMHVLRIHQRNTGHENVCLAGGVALNCSANGVLQRSRLFRSVFVQPASGDDGAALGAALYACKARDAQSAWGWLATPLLGPEFSEQEIAAELARHTGTCKVQHFPDFERLAEAVAERLEAGEVLGWFQGRMEFGPRALGARSILADPRRAETRDRVNMLIKKREEFRPFAPAVAEEAASEYFEIRPGEERTFAHMLFVTRVRDAYRERLAAITHVDGTARAQAVSREHNPRFWTVIDCFGRRTGIRAVLNTSFNVRGQPVVCSPTEAVDTFLSARLDALAIGNSLVWRAEA